MSGKTPSYSRTVELHECRDTVPFLNSLSNTICQAVAKSILRLGETTFLLLVALQRLFGKAAASMEQGLSSEKGSLEIWACIALFSSNLGLKICHHNLGGDPSYVGISWPVVMDAQVSVAGVLCVAIGSCLYSYLWQWRCPLLSPKCWRSLSWWMLFNSDLPIKVTLALTWSEALCWIHWSIWSWWNVLHGKMSLLSLTVSCSGLLRNH